MTDGNELHHLDQVATRDGLAMLPHLGFTSRFPFRVGPPLAGFSPAGKGCGGQDLFWSLVAC